MQRLLIGTGISTSAAPGTSPLDDALAAEAAGYDFVSASDHPVGTNPSYETLALLAWIAARTDRIRIASRVLGMPFRRPAMVAKAAESLHRLSGGRLILGLGGGYSDDEIHALGGRVPTPRQKVDGLADAITIIRNGWTEPVVSYQGAVHQVHELALTPKPVSPIPIWLGTYGNRALAVTGRLADGWIPSLGFASLTDFPQMFDRIHSAAAAAGRDPGAIRAICNLSIHLDPAARSKEEVLAGSAADIVEQLHGLTELGFSGFNFIVAADRARAVAEEVLPAVRTIELPGAATEDPATAF